MCPIDLRGKTRVSLSIYHLPDLCRILIQGDDGFVVPPLEQSFPFEAHQSVFSRTKQHTHLGIKFCNLFIEYFLWETYQLVADDYVDIEEFPEGYLPSSATVVFSVGLAAMVVRRLFGLAREGGPLRLIGGLIG